MVPEYGSKKPEDAQDIWDEDTQPQILLEENLGFRMAFNAYRMLEHLEIRYVYPIPGLDCIIRNNERDQDTISCLETERKKQN
ncbi:hypothetical protein JW898_04965 [Candidatus Woesearchaeota archaeon]|nr:hypothetical protein [Candidatus Woesearchaeota archaeon]